MKYQCCGLIALLALAGIPVLCAQAPAPAQATTSHEANFDAERKQANDLFLKGKIAESLPLYEDLCRQDQTIIVFAERHGTGLIAKALAMPEGPEKLAMFEQGMAEIRRGHSMGDNSPYTQTILRNAALIDKAAAMADGPEKKTAFEQGWEEIRRAQSLNDSSGLQQTMQSYAARTPLGSIISGVPLTVGYSYQGTPEAQAKLKEAEAAFQSQNIQVAVKLYMEAAALDPAWYTPRLYAGDMYFRMRDWNNAAIWFQKAIDIDPDRDTAYRYWGDSLFHAGDVNGAKLKFEQAVVAEPYSSPGWMKLGQWATIEKARVVRPLITIPEFTTQDGKLKVDPTLNTETGDGHSSWIVYQNARVAHGAMTRTQFIVAGATDANFILHPSGYYHSLAEEVESINAMLADVQTKLDAGTLTRDKLEPSLKNLLALQKSGMIECWILLNAADAGIRHDYPDYRKQHRDLLVKFIDCYNLAANPTAIR